MMLRCLGVALLLLSFHGNLEGQSPTLHMEVDTSTVTLGDRINLLIGIDHDPALQVIWPDSLNLEPFEVLEARLHPQVAVGDNVRSSATFTLTAFELGDLEIPSFELQLADSAGESTGLATNRFGIQVLSVGLDEGGDIREIRGPLGIPVNPMRLLLLFLLLALGAILARVLYKRWTRKPVAQEKRVRETPVRPPHEVALEALADLERSPLLERGQVKEYHIQVSDILRTYVEGRFSVLALEMTTADITTGLTELDTDPVIVDGFQDFLGRCDMVKFAKDRPDAETSKEVLVMGRTLVERTIPTPEETEPVQQSPAPSETEPGQPGSGTDEEIVEARI